MVFPPAADDVFILTITHFSLLIQTVTTGIIVVEVITIIIVINLMGYNAYPPWVYVKHLLQRCLHILIATIMISGFLLLLVIIFCPPVHWQNSSQEIIL